MVSIHTISYNQSINSDNQLYLIKADSRQKEKDDKRECGHYYIPASNHLPRKPSPDESVIYRFPDQRLIQKYLEHLLKG